MYISACFITKNEEKNIEKSIKSLQGMYDELIVTDTGSTDATVNIANKLGAKVYSFDWQNDFSLARNFTIDKACGDWLIFLDADNYYVGDVDIRGYLQEIDQKYPDTDALLLPEFDEFYPEKPPCRVGRIFRNRSYIRYHGAIHEVIGGIGRNVKLRVAEQLKIMHSGSNIQLMPTKLQRNLELLLMDSTKNGEHDSYYYYIAECYFGLKEYDKAIEYIKKAFASPVRHYRMEANYYHIYLESMRQCNYPAEDMVPIADEAIRKYPDMPEFYGEQGIILSSMGRLDEAFKLLNQCVEKYEYANRQSQEFGYFTEETMGIIYARLARISIVQGKKDFARIAAQLAIKSSRGQWGNEEKAMLCEQNHDTFSSRVIICIPIYKKTLSDFEKIALRQVNKVLSNYKRVFIAPESLEYNFGDYGKRIGVERFPDYFFHSVISYSALLLDVDFYRRFQDYEYILIYHTDAFVFSDRLQEFCNMGYDYIGAPMERVNPLWNFIGRRVGNGGLSLRKTETAIRILTKWKNKLLTSPLGSIFWQWEDVFWGYCSTRPEFEFKVPNCMLASKFSVQENIAHAYKKIEMGWRPFGCHSWWQKDYDFWKPIIESCGFDLNQAGNPSKNKYPRLNNYLESRRYINVYYLWGLYRKGCYNRVLALLDNWLEKFDVDFFGWQNNMEELICLWRVIEWEEVDKRRRTAYQMRISQALLRSMRQGVKYPLLWNLLITMVPFLKRYDYSVMQELSYLICDKWWQMWVGGATYNKIATNADDKKIIILTQAFDEADIIESFIRHTLSFADAILVDISLATNEVRKILIAMEKEGVPVVLHDKTLQREYFQNDVDVVLELFPHEFLLSKTEKVDIRQILATMNQQYSYVVEACSYADYLPYAHRDKFFLSRPLLRYLPGKKNRYLQRAITKDETSPIFINSLHMVIKTDIYRKERYCGIMPAEMELVDISTFAPNQKLKYVSEDVAYNGE